MAKYTKEDVKYLADCIRKSVNQGNRPYALLVGAGVSKSAGIPLASELLDQIKKSDDLRIHLRNFTEEELLSYPKCMEALTIEDRRTLLEPYLKNAKVNWASLAIATLLKPRGDSLNCGYIKRLLTFNFDNVLARACGICGYYPATYDFSQSPPKDFDFMSDGAITHLHGQGSGLKMLNSESETDPQADALGSLFTDTLAKYNLIVIGYSGLADNAFAEFEKRFENRTRIFWVGHSVEPDAHIEKLLNRAPATSNYFGGADADEFLIELANEIGCWPPKIFTNPDSHLLDELEPVNEYPQASGENILAELKAKLKQRVQDKETNSSNLKDLLFQGKFEEIIIKTENIETDEEKYARSWAFISIGNALSDLAKLRNDEALFNQAFEKYEAALKIRPDEVSALNNWGAALSDLAKLRNDEALFKQAFEKYEATLKIRPDEVRALNNWGVSLSDLAKLKNNEALFKQAFEKYEAALKIHTNYADALNNWGDALSDLAKLKNEEALFTQAFEKYEAALKIRPDEVSALNNWGVALLELAKLKNNEALFKQAFEKYEAALKIRPDFADALNNWGVALLELAKLKKDEALFNQAFEKYEAALKIRPDEVSALNNWGVALLELAKLKKDEALFRLAEEKLLKAQDLASQGNYNLACVYALLRRDMEREEQLKICKADGTLPDFKHLNDDEDLVTVRNMKWFKNFISGLK